MSHHYREASRAERNFYFHSTHLSSSRSMQSKHCGDWIAFSPLLVLPAPKGKLSTSFKEDTEEKAVVKKEEKTNFAIETK